MLSEFGKGRVNVVLAAPDSYFAALAIVMLRTYGQSYVLLRRSFSRQALQQSITERMVA
ncbi:MAG: hypothetical protein J7L51_01340 [Desulfurococcales archaeon]|nr:hypothetical protein [Desulfurococcales archaeon]